jgi:hypothetical protein
VTASATRVALAAAFGADPEVKAALGDPVRLGEPPARGRLPAAVWRRWETRPAGSSLADAEEHTVQIEVVTGETGIEAARAAVAALSAAATRMRPAPTDVRLVLIQPLRSDVSRTASARSWSGTVTVRIIAEPV